MSKTHSGLAIGLDYDGTVTEDPDLFTQLVKTIREAGHRVYIVTMRYMSECTSDPEFMRIAEHVDGFFATGRQAKKPYVLNHGVQIHIWIDDNPDAVHKSATEIWGTPSPEGTIVIEKHMQQGLTPRTRSG